MLFNNIVDERQLAQRPGTPAVPDRTRQRWFGNFGHGDKWIGLLYIPKWKEQIRCEDPDETIPPRSRPEWPWRH